MQGANTLAESSTLFRIHIGLENHSDSQILLYIRTKIATGKACKYNYTN